MIDVRLIALILAIVGVCSSFLVSNPFLTMFAMLVIAILLVISWRPGELPVLFFCLANQWLEVSTDIFHANSRGSSVAEAYDVDTTLTAILYGLIGLVLVAVGMRIALWRFRADSEWKFSSELSKLNIDTVFWYYFSFFIFSFFSQDLIWRYSGLTQALLIFLNIRWIFYILLAYLTLYQKKKRFFIFIAFMMEMAVGMVSFFSEFKQPLLLLLMVYLSLGRRLTMGRFIKAILVGLVMLSLGVFWTCVKGDYREFLVERSGAGEVEVSFASRYAKIAQLYSGIEFSSLNEGFEKLADRISYVEFFARTLQNVPAILPHERGGRIGAALQHCFTPRALNPDKPIVDQSELTSKYTGIEFDESTSVNLGYMAEYYIDFGFIGILVGSLFTGIFIGLIYRYFVGRKNAGLFSYITACVIALPFNNFGVNLIIMFGGLISSSMIMAFSVKFFLPGLMRLLTNKERVLG